MTISKALVAAIAAICLTATVFISWLRSQEIAIADKLDFAGKIVTVYTDSTVEGGGDILRDLEITKIEGNVVVTGVGVDTGHPDDWTEGIRIVIPWAKVESLYVMDEKQFNEKIKNALNRQ